MCLRSWNRTHIIQNETTITLVLKKVFDQDLDTNEILSFANLKMWSCSTSYELEVNVDMFKIKIYKFRYKH